MQEKQRNILPLTGLRFFAALFVCLAHIFTRFFKETPDNSWWIDEVARLSAAGMTLFFVLSGFVIHYNYSNSIARNPTKGLYDFMVARFARLMPLYLLLLFIDLVIFNSYKTMYHPRHTLEALPYYLTLTQSWFYKPMGTNALIYQFGHVPSVAWSVSTEWFFYLAYPIICFALLKMKSITTKVMSIGFISILTIGFIFAVSLNMPQINDAAIAAFGPIADLNTHQQDSFMRWLTYFAPYVRISEFIAGCLVAAIYMQLDSKPVSQREAAIGSAIMVIALLALIPNQYFIFHPPAEGLWKSAFINLHRCFGFAPLFAIIIFCCARYTNAVTAFLSTRFILWGGEISYSMYLLHVILIGSIAHFTRKISHGFIGLALSVLIIMVIAHLSYLMIESPARRVLRKWLALPRRKEAGSVVTA
jgi:peptidoglycan/LPS O-acetylase OafA/YrhL